MQIVFKRLGTVTWLQGTGSPEELADFVRLALAPGVDWRQKPEGGAVEAFGVAEPSEALEPADACH